MGNFLYRGVNCIIDEDNNGQLKPKGNKVATAIKYDGRFSHDGRATYGSCEENAIHAHHIETGLYGGCYLSTTTDLEIAKKFATSGGIESGYVYVLDRDLFKEHGVQEYIVKNPKESHEHEVTIRAKDCGFIPIEVIVDKQLIEI